MTADECRTEVLREARGEWGKVRIAREPSRYDRRVRYLVVEWCPPGFVGTAIEERAYRVKCRWYPADAPENLTAATGFLEGFLSGMFTSSQFRVTEA